MQTLLRTHNLLLRIIAAGFSLMALPLAGCTARRPPTPTQPAMSVEQVQQNPNLTAEEKTRAQFYLQQGRQAGAAPAPAAK